MIWSIGQFPELDHLDPNERAHVLANVPWWTYPLIVIRAALGAGVVGMIAGAMLSAISLNRRVTPWDVITCTAAVGMAFAGLYLWQLQRLRVVVRREIAAGFRGQRLPFCFACGYDLRAASADSCPECGHPTGDADV